jgi:hypothetical protein
VALSTVRGQVLGIPHLKIEIWGTHPFVRGKRELLEGKRGQPFSFKKMPSGKSLEGIFVQIATAIRR